MISGNSGNPAMEEVRGRPCAWTSRFGRGQRMSLGCPL